MLNAIIKEQNAFISSPSGFISDIIKEYIIKDQRSNLFKKYREENDLMTIKELPLLKKERRQVYRKDKKEKRRLETDNRKEFRSSTVKEIPEDALVETVGSTRDRESRIREASQRSQNNVEIVNDKVGDARMLEQKVTKDKIIEIIEELTRELGHSKSIVNVRILGEIEESPHDIIVQFGPIFGTLPKKQCFRRTISTKNSKSQIGKRLPVVVVQGVGVDSGIIVSHTAVPINRQDKELLREVKKYVHNKIYIKKYGSKRQKRKLLKKLTGPKPQKEASPEVQTIMILQGGEIREVIVTEEILKITRRFIA